MTAFLRRRVFATDHKTVGLQYIALGFTFFAIGGLLAMLMRWQLAYPTASSRPVPIIGQLMGWPGGHMPPDVYNATFSLHATLMIFFVIIPILVGGFGNYLTPLKIGARNAAFPRLGGLSLWLTVLAAVVLLAGPFLPGGAVESGWTGYPPFSALWGTGASPGIAWPPLPRVLALLASGMMIAFVAFNTFAAIGGPLRVVAAIVAIVVMSPVATLAIQSIAFDGQSCWFLSLLLVGVATVCGAINHLTTIVALRCPGMTAFRLPLTVWSVAFTSVLILLATPVLSVAMVMNLLDHHRVTSFFLPANWIANGGIQPSIAGGGYAVLHEHLFWFYSHPAVYVMILPAFGIVSDVLGVFARKPVFGYRIMIYAMGAITFLGFFVWAHHMFQSGMNPAFGTAFALSTMFIAVPSGIKVFNWLATLHRGSPRFTAAFCAAIAFVSLFVIGGLSGIFLASTPVNVHLHGTYFVVAHIHYVLFGGSTFGVFAAVYFWFPKMVGRLMNERLGVVHIALTYVAFNGVFLPMHLLGIRGVPRRYYDLTNVPSMADLQHWNVFMTHFAFLLGLAQLLFVGNLIYARVWGRMSPANPWDATTLEWTDAASPPIAGNFESTPVVAYGPYEYNNPKSLPADFLPQTAPPQ